MCLKILVEDPAGTKSKHLTSKFLIDDYGVDNIRTALVQHWAKRSGVTLNVFKSNSIMQKFIDGANSKEVSLLLTHFGVLFLILTLNDVEKSFELALDKDHIGAYI